MDKDGQGGRPTPPPRGGGRGRGRSTLPGRPAGGATAASRRDASAAREPAGSTPPAAAHRLSDADLGRFLFDHISDAVFATDAANRITHWTPSAERLFGFTPDEAVGRMFGDLLPFRMSGPDDERAFAEELSAGRPWRGTGSVRLADGRELWLASSVEPILVDGRVVGSVSVARDVTEERRAEDALAGIESAGQVLADQGPTTAALDSILGVLEACMGYDHLSLYLRDGTGLRLGAQLGYMTVPESIDLAAGVIGRVARSGHPDLVPDVAADPDYVAAGEAVVAELAVPLHGDEGCLGVLNIEATKAGRLGAADMRLAAAVADRLSTALLLNARHEALRDRARLFAALATFAGMANAILDPERLATALVEAVGTVVPSDTIVITTLDRDDGRQRVRAVRGLSDGAVGAVIEPGDGNTGRAIVERRVVMSDHHERGRYSSALREHVKFDVMNGIAVPLVHDDAVLGVISVGRAGPGATFSPAEHEVIVLLGSQAALALANAYLVAEVSALAIHDGLTGLYNRRHFDAALDLAIARYRRHAPTARLVAIMFDLDRFGEFNRRHGHLVGDAVLRLFGGILRERLRSADLVARYGGEEFIAVIEDCSLDDAVRLADEIRLELARRPVAGADGDPLRATVSAGCAAIDPANPTREDVIGRADIGLFMAKRAGRNRVVAA